MKRVVGYIDVPIDLDDIAHALNQRDALELIKAIDENRGDWAFTLAVADHFDKLRQEHAAEQAEDAAKRVAP